MCDLPDQGTKTSISRHHALSLLEQDDTALEEISLAGAELAVKKTTSIDAVADGNINYELGALGGDSGECGEPENDHETVEDQNSNDIVQAMENGKLLGEDNIGDDKPGDE